MHDIKSFRSSETEKIFLRQFTPRFSSGLTRSAQRKLALLDAAEKFDDLRIPPVIIWRSFPENAEDSTAFASTTSGECVFAGAKGTLMRWRLLIIIEGAHVHG